MLPSLPLPLQQHNCTPTTQQLLYHFRRTTDNPQIDTDYVNHADYDFTERLSARFFTTNTTTSTSPPPTFIIVGLNEGKLLASLLKCAPPPSSSAVSVHAFDIQAKYVRAAQQRHVNATRSFHFNLAGVSNTTSKHARRPVAGVNGTAGLYDEDVVAAALPNWARATVKGVLVPVTTLTHYATTHNVSRADYTVIDAEGHDSLVIQGMRLHVPAHRRRFSAFQYELGITVGDPRKPYGSASDAALAADLVAWGYDLYLIGLMSVMRITPDFFRLPGVDCHGNVLAVHPAHAHPAVLELVAGSSSTPLPPTVPRGCVTLFPLDRNDYNCK
jgi:hypothetical protein